MNGYTPEAYSLLGSILAQRNMSVLALQRQMAQVGVPVNIKSLYRLADATPLQKIDLHIAAAICKLCQVSLNDLISFQKPKAQLRHLDQKIQVRLNQLMEKNNEGQLTATERREFNSLAERAHRISIANARTLLAERRRASASAQRKKKPASANRAVLAR